VLPEIDFVQSFAVGEIIGAGGFSQVRLGERLVPAAVESDESDNSVALKILGKTSTATVRKKKPFVGRNEEFAARIELSVLCVLGQCSQIVQPVGLYRSTLLLKQEGEGGGSTGGKFVLGMENVAGGDVLEWIAARERYTESHARQIMRALLLALQHCHDRHIVHRDVKVQNLMMTSVRSDQIIVKSSCDSPEEHFDAKLIDFGLSVYVGDESQQTFDVDKVQSNDSKKRRKEESGNKLTQYCGTVGFLAPEMLARKPYGTPIDMWAAGVVLYILLGNCSLLDTCPLQFLRFFRWLPAI